MAPAMRKNINRDLIIILNFSFHSLTLLILNFLDIFNEEPDEYSNECDDEHEEAVEAATVHRSLLFVIF